MFSPALERIFGWSFTELTESQLFDAIPLLTADGKTPLPPEDRPLTRARHGEVVSDAVVAADTADGRRIHLRCNAAPLRDEGGTNRGAVLWVQNITLETAGRVEQEELRHRLIDTVNHEFRTPLTKLMGHLEILDDSSDELPVDAQWSVGVAQEAATELSDLVLRVSGLADLGSHAKLNLTDCNLAGLLRDVAHQFAPVLAARAVGLDADLSDRVTATLDPGEITQAVVELLANAGQFAPPGSRVRLGLQVTPPSLEVSVIDQGCGIPARDRDRLLQPFERGSHPGQKTNSKGLGLAIAQTIAAAHGGTLTMRDNDPTGLVVTLSLPQEGRPW
ncbi:PAS domain S-box-containing protein [Nocardioides psychrotolerans]|uniref:Sensor-like histidine kinase SenX3 n=2 Tax=Nocardioides psychrotolerans TaxID=1005945 RepID=A0A1I3EQJ2_9ACTN|nr:PAS domain S-box-containing protein [Nocardioides psychrotolerans]